MSIAGPETAAAARRYDAAQLRDFAAALFAASGLAEEDAARAAGLLVEADLRGVWSHGVARVGMYRERIRKGVAKARPEIRIDRVAPAALLVDGDDGLGLVVAPKAMEAAIALARETGIAIAGVKRSGHFGTTAPYLRQATEAGCIVLSFTTSSPALAPWGAARQFLGTSPFGFAAPAPEGRTFLVDMAMSRVARGKLKFAAQRGQSVPEGYALDKAGRPTTDGKAAFEGIMLPFGEHKGAAMSWMMDVAAGVFTGAAHGGQVANPFTNHERPQGVGHTFIVARADLFMPLDAYAARMAALDDTIKALPRAAGFDRIMSPGEPEERRAAENRRDGVPLTPDVVEALRAEGHEAGIAWPFD